MIYIAVLCNPKITAEPLYNTPLFIGPYAAANNTALLARRPSQGTKLYCLVNRGSEQRTSEDKRGAPSVLPIH